MYQRQVPKGVSIEAFSAEYILAAADELNGRPRKKLSYRTPEALFDEFLASVYAAAGCEMCIRDSARAAHHGAAGDHGGQGQRGRAHL